MKTLAEQFLSNLDIQPEQFYRGMSVFPLFGRQSAKQDYLSLKQGLNLRLVVISEVSQDGSVGQLKVLNEGELPILLLDGEEISGAKQNRILNTTILLREKAETIIPVSCTERGRWSYDKPYFEESGNIMTAGMRGSKLENVSYSLERDNSFRGDQGKVWNDIDEYAHKMQVHSQTSAMKDVYEASSAKMADYEETFNLHQRQSGILVCFGDRVIGMDYVSKPEVWADLHFKLVKSYAMEHIMSRGNEKDGCKGAEVRFMNDLQDCRLKRYDSVGYGEDARFSNSRLSGSVLVWQETIIHWEAYSRGETVVETGYHSPRKQARHLSWLE